MRERLLTEVMARIAAAQSGADTSDLMSERALAEVVELLSSRHRGEADLPVLRAAGLLFHYRALRCAPETRLVQVAAACELLGPVYAVDPALTPWQVRAFYDGGRDPCEAFSVQTGFTTDPVVWWELARQRVARCPDVGDSDDLRLAVGLLRLARDSAGPDHPDLLKYLEALAALLSQLRAATRDPDVCREAAEVGRIVVALMPDGHPARSLELGSLGLALITLAQLTHDLTAALEAVAVCREGLRSAGADHGINLGAALLEVARLDGDDCPRFEALQVFRDAARSEVGALAVANLRVALRQLLDDGADRRRLAAWCRASLPPGGADTLADVPALDAMVRLLLEAYEEDGDLQHAREAVTLGRRAIAVAGHDQDLAQAASNTASALASLAQWTDDLAAAREAVELGRRAVGLMAAPAADNAELPLARSNLSGAFGVLWEVTGDLEALRDAVDEGRKAVELTDPGHASYATISGNHASYLHRLASLTNDAGLLRKAMAARRTTLDTPGLTGPQRVRLLHGLAAMLTDLYMLDDRGGIELLREAAEAAERARETIEADHAGHGLLLFVLTELTRAYALLGSASGDLQLLQAAVDLAQQVASSAEGEAAVLAGDETGQPSSRREALRASGVMVAAVESERGFALARIAQLTGDDMLRASALAAYDRVLRSPGARADVRLRAAVQRASIARLAAPAATTLDYLADAVQALRLAFVSGSLRSDREMTLRRFSTLAGAIIDAGVQAVDPGRAIELVEQCRGLFSADSMDIRSDLGGLRAGDPLLAAELVQASRELRALDAREQTAAARDPAGRRMAERKLAAERTRLTRRWTELQQQAMTAMDAGAGPADPARLAGSGPIALVAATPDCGYALLVTGEPGRPFRAVQLPELGLAQASDRVLTFLTARHFAISAQYPLRVRRKAQAEIRSTLDWLWRIAGAPILAELGFDSPPGDGVWPRLWWCPVGFLSYLPWHAAGCSQEGVMDRVISSYTASLHALGFVRRMPEGRGRGSTLLVAAPDAPGAAPLRGVRAEIDEIKRLIPDAMMLSGERATKAAVLAALADHAVVHLACHAMTDVKNPSASRLLLADYGSDPLTVADLSALHVPGRDLAFLSACSTSEVSPDLADEALHLTAAFQLLGFRHVIGALWPVSDATAVKVSRAFYDCLTDSGRRAPRSEESARALHSAVRGLRSEYAATPTIWAAYVHTGA